MYRTSLLLALTALVATIPSTTSHSFMVSPDAYNRVFLTESCKGSECSQACPNIRSSGMNNTPQKPAAVWSRGKSVTVKWAKNNHRGGLVRVALVPVHVMMSRTWHKKLALWYGCWESGEYTCSGYECGTDTNKEAFQRRFTIPTVFPDGDYVIAVLWYGGLHFSRDRGMFPDYYSCSFVKIQGGLPLGGSFQPFWEAGDTGQFKNGDLCQSSADEPGDCPHDKECMLPSMWTVAKEFKNGNQPDKITPKIVADGFKDKPDLTNVPGGPENTPPPTTAPPTTTEAEDDDRSGGAPPPSRTTTTPPTTSSNSGNVKGAKVCTGKVCCPKKCGKCGGSGCNRRPGGGENCCFSKIVRSGRVCGEDPPPCVEKRR